MQKETNIATQVANPFTVNGFGGKVEVKPAPNSRVTAYNVNAFLDFLSALEGSQRLHLMLNKLTFAYLMNNDGVWPDEHDDLYELQLLTEFVSALHRKPTDLEKESMEIE